MNIQVSKTTIACIYIQEAWRRHRDCLSYRKDCASNRFFEDQKGIMSNHFIKKKTLQTGMFKEVVKKVMQSGTDWTAIKKRILELYMAR